MPSAGLVAQYERVYAVITERFQQSDHFQAGLAPQGAAFTSREVPQSGPKPVNGDVISPAKDGSDGLSGNGKFGFSQSGHLQFLWHEGRLCGTPSVTLNGSSTGI